jgi:hypothetical protein
MLPASIAQGLTLLGCVDLSETYSQVRRHAWRGDYAAGGGCSSTRGKAPSIHAQLGALDVQMVIAGLARFGSSKLPTRTKIKCGRASASLKRGVPQSRQNRRCMQLPLSATLEQSFVFPVTVNVVVRKQAPTVPLPAPRYWQSRHQHTRVVIGGSTLSQRTAPQRHRPVTGIALSNVNVMETPLRRSYS